MRKFILIASNYIANGLILLLKVKKKMETYISILRGINVSGQKKIKMADLKSLYENMGFQDVQTYIQSGNVIFKTNITKKNEIRQKIQLKIKEHYNFSVPVLILNIGELNAVFLNNPFLNKRKEDISKLHVTFLDEKPKVELVREIENLQSASDEFIVSEKTIYVFCPNGYGRTKLNNTFFEKKLKTTATTRNWKTICKLVELSN